MPWYALVTSTVRWAIGTLVPTAQNTPGPDAMCNFVGVGLTFANSPSWSSAEQFGPSGILPSLGDDVGGVLCGMYYFCSNIGTLLGACCRRPRPCLVLCHRKKFTPRLFDMACVGIALGLITPAFLGCTVFCAIMDLRWHLLQIANYGISGGTCGCLLFKCNIRPLATTSIVFKNHKWRGMCSVGKSVLW